MGTHQQMAGFSHSLATSVTLKASGELSSSSIPYQLDGDPGGVLPVEIRVLPGRLKLVI